MTGGAPSALVSSIQQGSPCWLSPSLATISVVIRHTSAVGTRIVLHVGGNALHHHPLGSIEATFAIGAMFDDLYWIGMLVGTSADPAIIMHC